MPDTDLRTRDKKTTKQSPSSHKADFLLGRCMQYQNPNTQVCANHTAPSSGKTKAERQRGKWKTALECYRQDRRASRSLNFTQLSRVGTHNKTNKHNVFVSEVSGQAARKKRIFIWGKGFQKAKICRRSGGPEHGFMLASEPFESSSLQSRAGAGQAGRRVPSTGTSDSH